MEKIKLSKNILNEVIDNENKCVDCKICFNSCPMMKDYSMSPKKLLKEIVDEKCVNKNIPYSCMLCNICTIKCPKDIDLNSMFYNMRKDIFKINQKSINNIGYKTVKVHQSNSFSPIFSKSFIKPNTKSIFFPGCSLSSYKNDIVLKTYEYLKCYIEDISLVFECCGKPTLSIGDLDRFNNYYSKLESKFNENDIHEVIVACPNCYKTIKHNSKNIKVKTIWEVITEYGIPKELNNYYKDIDKMFSLHDPCPIRDVDIIHESVRTILNELGVKIVEFDKNRNKSECCGSGGMVRVINPQLSKKQTNKRANEAKTDNIVTYCESCCESMLSVNKKTLHILDFMFNEDVLKYKTFTQEKSSTIKKWKNRYTGIKLANKKVK